jgi:Leucine-rich repeat (LRR) protein
MERNLLSGFIPSEIGTLSRLTHLGLEGNRLQGFPPTLGQLTNLERLLLSGNPLNATIPTEIGKMVQLSE